MNNLPNQNYMDLLDCFLVQLREVIKFLRLGPNQKKIQSKNKSNIQLN